MAQKESHTERAEKSSLPNPMSTEFAEMGKKRIEEFVNMQTELLNEFQETNRQWFDRAQSEANLASEFVSKLTAARSIPEAMETCQEWTSRRFEMMAEDGKHLLADTQKFMEAATRLLPNGSLFKGGGGLST
ncbi:MAG: phasin family protein [Xanthobacteraceae bacterium]